MISSQIQTISKKVVNTLVQISPFVLLLLGMFAMCHDPAKLALTHSFHDFMEDFSCAGTCRASETLDKATCLDGKKLAKNQKIVWSFYAPAMIVTFMWMGYIFWNVKLFTTAFDTIGWVVNWGNLKRDIWYRRFAYTLTFWVVGTFIGGGFKIMESNSGNVNEALYALFMGGISSLVAIYALYSPNPEALDFSEVRDLPVEIGWFSSVDKTLELLGEGIIAYKYNNDKILKSLGLDDEQISRLIKNIKVNDLSTFDLKKVDEAQDENPAIVIINDEKIVDEEKEHKSPDVEKML